MGIVYSAHDPALDRRVALKVLQPARWDDERSHRRLAAEARALARLDHPNVVKVHDVLALDGQTIVVMELVEGTTLAEWKGSGDRGWRECIAVYAQAAEGLIAAHGVEVIHRDFKPGNAVISGDGRVRVLDFGLAQLDHDSNNNANSDACETSSLTETGDLFGTLAYASPEQLRGEPLSPASDQYSFCVSLFWAISVNPFSGSTAADRLASMAVKPASLEGKAPIWLREVLARGLAFDPSLRYPTLAALVRDLRRPRGWRRWRIPALATAIAGTSVALTLGFRQTTVEPATTCDGGFAEISGVWNAEAKRQVASVIDGSGMPYSAALRDHALTGIDAYATSWSEGHRAACEEHRRGVTSSTLLDRRMLCLTSGLGDLRATLDVLMKTDRSTLFNAMDVVARIPSVARCADLERLAADVEPPDPSIRDQVTEVRGQIARGEALMRAGRSVAAQAAARDATLAAKRISYAPLEIDAALAEGRVLIAHGELERAKGLLKPARQQALELKRYSTAVEAAARLIYVEGMGQGNQASLEREVDYLLPLAAGHECDRFERPLLLNNIGTVYLAIGKREMARQYFQRAKQAIPKHGPIDLELAVIDRNLAMLTADPDARAALMTSVSNRLRESLGDNHPSTLESLVVYADYVPDPVIAYELLVKTTEAYRRYHPTLRRELALAELFRAFVARELGDHARAVTDYERAVETTRETSDPDVEIAHHLAMGELAIERGDPAAAVDELAHVSASRLHATAWYDRADGLRAEVDLGLAAVSRSQDDVAVRHFELALAGYPQIVALNEEVKYRQLANRARYELARIYRRRGNLARARELGELALGFYRTASAVSYRWLIERGNELR